MSSFAGTSTDGLSWSRTQFLAGDGAGPVFWEDLVLDELGYTPPRCYRAFRSDGELWTDTGNLLVFSDGKALDAWIRA